MSYLWWSLFRLVKPYIIQQSSQTILSDKWWAFTSSERLTLRWESNGCTTIKPHQVDLETRAPSMLGFFKITNKLEHTSTSIAEDFPQWAIFKFPIRHAVCLVACVADTLNLLYWLYKWLRQVRGLAATQAICLADILKFILGSEVRGIKPNHMYYSLLKLKMISFVLFPG